MKNIFTIDTEDWYHANFEDNLFTNDPKINSTVEENVDRYLELFSKHKVKATFFVLGFVAEEYPQVLRKIIGRGHEIACHGYGHQLVYKQTKQEFREDIHKGKVLCEDIIGQAVSGYRAPSWSITDQSLWAAEILEDEGFLYSSSIFPTKNFLYGIPYAPRFLHTYDTYGKDGLKIIEVPPSTYRMLNINLPFSGGFYFRALPGFLIRHFTELVNQSDESVIFYLHPREIDPRQPRLKLNARDSLIHYYGINQCESKLAKILKSYEWMTMKEYILQKNVTLHSSQ